MRYISLLRGINVGGHNIVPMARLKTLYESCGFKNVVTYIQSGNVIFDSAERNIDGLCMKIEDVIELEYAFHVPADIRTHLELKKVLENSPFEKSLSEENGSMIIVVFLKSESSREQHKALLKYVRASEQLSICKKEIYLYSPEGYGKSKLTCTLIEKKLGTSATTRNWKSVKKLYELSAVKMV